MATRLRRIIGVCDVCERPVLYHEVRQWLGSRDALLAMGMQLRSQRHALLQWPVVVEGDDGTSTN